MGEANFLINHCPSCGGGIEFPAHGVGQQIGCPHCHVQMTLQKPVTDKADSREEIVGLANSAQFPLEEKGLLALSWFSFPVEPSVLARAHFGCVSDEMEAEAIVGQFIVSGLLQDASSDLVALLQGESSTTLKSLAKERKLPHSGTKDTLAKKLVNADPEGMRARFVGKRFFVCSEKGRAIVTEWRDLERGKKVSAERECICALKEKRFKDACMAVSTYEATRLIPRGLGIDWKHYDAQCDLQILQTIFAARLPRQAEFGSHTMEVMRVAAAMIHLWGTNNPSAWIRDGIDEEGCEFDVEARMLLFHAMHQRRLADLKSVGITRVKILGSGWSEDCEVCRSDWDKLYPIDQCPSLPHEECTCEENGCRCVAVATE